MFIPLLVLTVTSFGFVEAAVSIEAITVWPDSSDTGTRYSSDKGVLREIHEIQENFRFELNLALDGKAASFKHVGLLFEDTNSGSGVIGTIPSVHIPMNSTGGSSKVFKAVYDLSKARTVNPDGTTFRVFALIVPETGSAPVRKDLGKVRLAKSSIRQDPVAVGSKKIVPELASYVPDKVIKHMFKPDPARSAPFFSLLFTGITLTVPTLFLLLGLWKLGANARGLKTGGVSSLVFAGLLAAFVSLMVAFFGFLNLVQTSALFLVLLVPLVLIGNRVLCQVRAAGDLRNVYSSD